MNETYKIYWEGTCREDMSRILFISQPFCLFKIIDSEKIWQHANFCLIFVVRTPMTFFLYVIE